MAALLPNSPAGDDRNLITVDENYLAPSFEDRLQMFWDKHSRTILVVVVAVVLAILAKGAFGYFAAQREAKIAAEYAAASNTAQLQAFAQAYPTARLAGVAHLRLADESYAAGAFAVAEVDYSAAAKLLGDNPLATRAVLGAAISLLQVGSPGAQPALQAIANDTKLAGVVRAEAAFHLAVGARAAGQVAEATRWTDLVISNDAGGFWSQRAMQLRDSLPLPDAVPAAATAVAPAASPSVTFPGAK
jgi:hypothetical protein